MSENNNTNGNLLEVRNLKVHFPIEEGVIFKKTVGHIRAVDGVSFSVRRGETLGLVGESGCGKSTTARAVAQLYPATDGEILLNGIDLAKATPRELLRHRKDVQMVFQDPYASLNPRMTVRDIIAEPMQIFVNRGLMQLSRMEIDRRVEELMEKVGLNKYFKNRYPHEYSGGQRQRIGIARALALNPQLILADEPISALDVSIQSQILNLLRDLQKEFHLTYLFIAHDLAVIKYISDRVAVMYLGVIVEVADSEALYEEPLHPYTQALLSAIPIPDPEVEGHRKRIILTGDVPSPDKERSGCYFYDRCPKRMDICAGNIPRLQEVRPGHQTACFLYFEATPETTVRTVTGETTVESGAGR
ncbi:MAG: ABC transporter ATP-binding protein [Alkalispirochaeta sp.]